MESVKINEESLDNYRSFMTEISDSLKANSIGSLMDSVDTIPLGEVTPSPPAAVTPLQNLL